MKSSLVLLLTFLVALTVGTPDHNECTNKLYQGIMTGFVAGQEIDSIVKQNPGVASGSPMTCELLFTMGKLLFQDFDHAGCSWGYKNDVFYERILGYIGEFLDGDCKWLSGNVLDKSDSSVAEAYDSITCGVEDELIAAADKLVQCVKLKFYPMIMSPKPYEPGKDICYDIATFGPCLEGLVDSCHNDNGEASEALLDFFAAYGAFFIRQIGMMMAPTQVQGYMTQVAACSDEQLGPLKRFTSINFDYEADPSKIPSKDVLSSKLNSGHFLTPNPARMAQLKKRVEELAKKNGLGGMDGGLPINLG